MQPHGAVPNRNGSADEQKKFQVFVSSPFKGMEHLRQAAKIGVTSSGHVPIALEDVVWSGERDMPIIVNRLRDCQIYLIIVGHLRGSPVDNAQLSAATELIPEIAEPLQKLQGERKEISYTELELMIACELERRGEIKILTFLFDQQHVETARVADTTLPRPGSQERADADHAYWSYYRYCDSNHRFGPRFQFSPLDHQIVQHSLPAQIREGVLNVARNSQLPGWVKQPAGMDEVVLGSVYRNALVQQIIKALVTFERLDERFIRNAPRKRRAGQFFWATYGPDIIARKSTLFLESGSTVALAAEVIGKSLSADHRIFSNNVVAHLLVWLVHRHICELSPSGVPDPEDKFGAIFGPIIDTLYAGQWPGPSYAGKSLPAVESWAIEEMVKSLEVGDLIVAAASGLQLSDDVDVKYEKADYSREHVPEALIKAYRGFHVGSPKNKLFKRFLYHTRKPALFLLDDSKVDCPVRVGECHFIFDREFTWQNYIASQPVAISLGCARARLSFHERQFQESGFEVVTDESSSGDAALIAVNPLFGEQFGLGKA